MRGRINGGERARDNAHDRQLAFRARVYAACRSRRRTSSRHDRMTDVVAKVWGWGSGMAGGEDDPGAVIELGRGEQRAGEEGLPYVVLPGMPLRGPFRAGGHVVDHEQAMRAELPHFPPGTSTHPAYPVSASSRSGLIIRIQ
jgi:hypothetical protein